MAYASLHQRLHGPIAEALKKELGVKNVHALPKITKVIVNVGINRSKMEGKDVLESIIDGLQRITGQKPIPRPSRKAISNFKIREGLIVGVMVTLRGKQMEAFVDRLVSYVLPRIRDFRGLPTALDGRGNYALGLTDHSIFPEIPATDLTKTFGMQIQVTTNAGNDKAGRALLKQIGFPFRPDHKSAEAAAASA